MPDPAVQEWLEKASEDEETVIVLLASGGPWAPAAYHVQQAAEKRIKAALVAAGVAPPKSHDLPQLLSLIPGGAPNTAVEIAASMTSAYAWLTRYPGAPPIDKQHVEKAMEHLAEITFWCNEVIAANEPQGP